MFTQNETQFASDKTTPYFSISPIHHHTDILLIATQKFFPMFIYSAVSGLASALPRQMVQFELNEWRSNRIIVYQAIDTCCVNSAVYLLAFIDIQNVPGRVLFIARARQNPPYYFDEMFFSAYLEERCLLWN